MKTIRLRVPGLVLGVMCLLSACGGADDSGPTVVRTGNASLVLQFDGASQIDSTALAEMALQPEVRRYVDSHAQENANQGADAASTGAKDTATASRFDANLLAATSGAIGETPLPHATQAPVSPAERQLIKAYLNAPSDRGLSSFLAVVSLNKSLLNPFNASSQGERFKYTLLARYFLGRSLELGRREAWLTILESATQDQIDRVVSKGGKVTSEEDHPAHRFFNQTFNYRESDRYIALQQLLDDFVGQPKNVYTAFTLTAANTWIGGEAEYGDPTALYNFVVGGYLSVHTMALAQQLEVAWLADNRATPRFRMATILGGFSALNRRWLTKLHGDDAAVAALDNEHRQWRLVQRAFHAFTVGLSFFEEQANFAEGLAAWQDSFVHCAEVPVRTCSNLPRFSHNFASFVLGYVDFLLKAGQTDAARQFLSIRNLPDQFPPMAAYKTWDLGRASWESRGAQVAWMRPVTSESNLVGNIYFSNYYLWQRKLIDRYLHQLAPAQFTAAGRLGEFHWRRGEVKHLREAMPFDDVEVGMALKALSANGVRMHFEFYRVGGNNERIKLAHGEAEAAWVARDALEPSPMPAVYLDALQALIPSPAPA